MNAIAAIYDCVDDAEAYAALPAALAARLGGRSCVIFDMDEDLRPFAIQSSYFPPEQIALQLTGEIAAIDILTRIAVRPEFIGKVNTSERFWDVSAFRRTPFFHEAVRPFDDDTARAMGGLWRTHGGYMSVAVHLGSGRRGFAAADVAAMNEMLPHVRRMLELRRRLGAAEARAVLSESALDGQADAVFVVDAQGRPQLMNCRAKALLDGGDGLVMTRVGLGAVRAGECRTLALAIARACARQDGHGGALRVSRQRGPPLRVLVSPLSCGQLTHALLLVNDPARIDQEAVAKLRAFYGLSEAEAETAVALSRGLTPHNVAAMRGVSMPTVRTQIRHALSKTEARGIAELVGLIVSAPGRATPN